VNSFLDGSVFRLLSLGIRFFGEVDPNRPRKNRRGWKREDWQNFPSRTIRIRPAVSNSFHVMGECCGG